jgi:hypothetical protein
LGTMPGAPPAPLRTPEIRTLSHVVTDMVVSLCCDLLICNIVRRSSCECFEAQAPYAGTFSRTVWLKGTFSRTV